MIDLNGYPTVGKPMTFYSDRTQLPEPVPVSIQRWNSNGYRHCRVTEEDGSTRTWISKDPSWDWIETTDWETPVITQKDKG